MATYATTEAFFQAFESLLRSRGDGKAEMDPAALEALVGQHPEEAIIVTEGFLKTAVEESEPRYFQRALALAVAYQQALGDDSLYLHVEDLLRTHGAFERAAGIYVFPEKEEDPNAFYVLEISREWLQKNDISQVVAHLTVEGATAEHRAMLARRRAKYVLAFAVDEDPREVYEIAEVRRYVAHLFDALPGLFYFLNPELPHVMVNVCISCMVDLEKLPNSLVDLNFQQAVGVSVVGMVGIIQVAQHLGTDPMVALHEAFSHVPQEIVAAAVAQLKQYVAS